MGSRGPVPKRSEERRRTNKESKPQKAKAGSKNVTCPPAQEKWHPIAASWYESLTESGQSEFYEASDWHLAQIIAESISRDLKPQVVGIHEESGEVVRAVVPMKGANLSAYLKAMAGLMVSEGDRRRAGLELERGAAVDTETPAGVTAIDDYRDKLGMPSRTG